jgi:predicted phage gp36 major capsid-like protein
MLAQVFRLLEDVVMPNLETIQINQAQQRLQTEQLNRTVEEFRAEMRLKFTEIRAELAACRIQVEDAIVTLHEAETGEVEAPAFTGKKTLIH